MAADSPFVDESTERYHLWVFAYDALGELQARITQGTSPSRSKLRKDAEEIGLGLHRKLAGGCVSSDKMVTLLHPTLDYVTHIFRVGACQRLNQETCDGSCLQEEAAR